MTQVFADDDQASSASFFALPMQRPALAPAMMAGKGVRAVRCLGCQRDTLPRTDDGAHRCGPCSEVLAEASSGWPRLLVAPRWLRRRTDED
jgi:hypothetical protein